VVRSKFHTEGRQCGVICNLSPVAFLRGDGRRGLGACGLIHNFGCNKNTAILVLKILVTVRYLVDRATRHPVFVYPVLLFEYLYGNTVINDFMLCVYIFPTSHIGARGGAVG
jgi:hypothetical protein